MDGRGVHEESAANTLNHLNDTRPKTGGTGHFNDNKNKTRIITFHSTCSRLVCRQNLLLKMMKGGYNLYLQQGARNYEDSEESYIWQQSEGCQNSQETNSSHDQEETVFLNPWSRILNDSEAEQRHEALLNALINEYKRNGDSKYVARVKSENALVPFYGNN